MPPLKRPLTDAEITAILDALTPTPGARYPVIEASRVAHIRATLRPQLAAIELYPSLIPALTERIQFFYAQTQAVAGESVGILAAQSIGEKQTQLVLDSFHHSGITDDVVVSGVPRFSQLLLASQSSKGVMSRVFLKPLQNLNYHDALVFARTLIPFQKVGGLVARVARIRGGVRSTGGGHALILDVQKMYTYRIDPGWIACRIMETDPEIDVIVHPLAFHRIDVYLPLDTDLKSVLEVHVSGIPGCGKVYLSREPTGGWVVDVVGQNLRGLLAHPFVDVRRTHSNDMWEILAVFGIEAVRKFLIREFLTTIASDSYINARHIQLLVDLMTFTGSITPVSRHGMQKNQSGAITRGTFEETLENFMSAGLYAEVDDTIGVAAAVVLGKPSIAGTGCCSLLYDESMR